MAAYAWAALLLLACWGSLTAEVCAGQVFQLPTPNRALFDRDGEARYFVGTVGRPWSSGTYGCVRSEGRQLHEGIDIRCVRRDANGEAADPVLATADGEVAYVNSNSALSNYGRYLVLRHRAEGLEFYTLYAHLARVRPGVQAGTRVRAGEPIALMGRSSNTRQGISKDRAHLHFEINLRISDRFTPWRAAREPNQRNDHGEWNGLNFLGLDPAAVLREQAARGPEFSLVRLVRGQTELCRVFVRDRSLGWVRRHPPLVTRNPVSEREGVAGYELRLNYAGVPFEVIPRAASEVRGSARFVLLSVNEAEQQRRPCRRLVVRRGARWELGSSGLRLLDLLTY